MAYYPAIPYTGSQVIISSERVHLHAKNDSIVLTGAQSVALSSIKTVNLDAAAGIVLQAPSVKLGSVNATEKLVLGNTFMNNLNEFLVSIKNASIGLQSVAAGSSKLTPELAAAMLKLSTFASSLSNNCEKLKNQLSGSLSDTCKCI